MQLAAMKPGIQATDLRQVQAFHMITDHHGQHLIDG